MDLTTEPDGILKGNSAALRRSLCWANRMLTFYDPETNQYMRNLRAERERADAERTRADAERTAKEAAESQLQALGAELRRLRGE